MNHALFIFNARLLDESIDGPGAIFIVEGKIRSVFQGYFININTVKEIADSILKEDGYTDNIELEFYDAHGLTVTPAFIDLHVHFRDPGFTEKEDLITGLKAATAGGYGTVVTMPNTKPVVSTAEQALEIVERAKKINLCNLIQSVSITNNFDGKDTSNLNNLDRIDIPLITEDGHDVESSSVILDGMIIAGQKKIIVSCHCEDCTLALKAKPHREKALEIMNKYNLPAWGGDNDFFDVPPEAIEEIDNELSIANEILALAENVATSRNIEIAKLAGCHIHICHVSTAQALQTIRNVKQDLMNEVADFYADMADAAYDCSVDKRVYSPIEPFENGFSVTCEVTPHHIALCGIDEPNIRALVNPPLRSEDDRLVVIDAIRDGTVDVIATDHAPHTLEDKAKGAPGFSGIESSYGICNSVLVKEGQISAKRLSQLMSANPARILKLSKGILKNGFDADITILDPDEKWVIDSSMFYSKGKATPFDGRCVSGKVKSVYVNGKKIF